MAQMGLPVEFSGLYSSGSILQPERKGEKKTYYCNACSLELNSQDTANSHFNGLKHLKRVKDLRAENRLPDEVKKQRETCFRFTTKCSARIIDD